MATLVGQETVGAQIQSQEPLFPGVGANIASEKIDQIGPSNHASPSEGEYPRPADAANEKQVGPVHRQGTFKGKLKNQKEKIKTKTSPPGGFDPTPIPDAPPGFTVRFTFHRATNLPAADIGTGSSDPFLTATLTTALPKRHKEDPDLFYRTRTIRKTLEPQWDQEWTVANVPSSGFKLKCRLYDEDWPDHNDRLGNVTIVVNRINEAWEGFAARGDEFEVKKRSGSKRAYLLKACSTAFTKGVSMTPKLYVSAVVLGKSEPPHGHMYTVGPTYFFKHFSPMIGRMTGVKVNRNEAEDSNDHDTEHPSQSSSSGHFDRRTQKYDFQANEIQLAGPVPPKLYHRYVEFRPIIGLLFRSRGLRGKILNKALHHQHGRIYNFDKGTDWGAFQPCSEEASLQFLKMAHFDEGGRIFTYIITLDGLMRFTETGKEFGIDLLSKHTMHSDAAIYIACSGEFFIRRRRRPEADGPSHPDESRRGPLAQDHPTTRPQDYQLIIDNDSGTYRPDKSVLPYLQTFLERNLPGLDVVTLACDDPEDQRLKDAQRSVKKKEGRTVNMVLNRSPSASSFSSDDISDLEDMERAGEVGRRSKRERAWELLEEPRRIRELAGMRAGEASSSRPNDSGVGV
ncbi:hypothetical protein GGS23DRAFT_316006 [Durotheca rogersii]|uniref:uncharacterized protein n=1 Tax=Durotheca rogersii TaxID=419775 RepID=UPI00221E6D17|nr:uncharacterized protein GGS23DRAFT_316006 [Durotheca rogersii]KAI5859624.1 hypothetical protein GGS23DRAFT_316006 [Durotheca rogersii]